mgnify:CR=1 FL=1
MIKLTPTETPIEYFSGDDLAFTLRFRDTEGDPVDVSDWDLELMLVNAADEETPAVLAGTPAAGDVTVYRTDEAMATAGLDVRSGRHRWWLKRGDTGRTLLAGPFRTRTVDDQVGTLHAVADIEVTVSVDTILDITYGGPPGQPGAAGDANETHTFTNEQVWVIDHSIGFNPNVTAVSASGEVMLVDVDYVSSSLIHITHAVPLSGTVYLS